jgi:hypothetical protein
VPKSTTRLWIRLIEERKSVGVRRTQGLDNRFLCIIFTLLLGIDGLQSAKHQSRSAYFSPRFPRLLYFPASTVQFSLDFDSPPLPPQFSFIAVMSAESWPPQLKFVNGIIFPSASPHSSFREWVASCLGQMTDANREEAQAELRQVISDAYSSKTLWTTDWAGVQLKRCSRTGHCV